MITLVVFAVFASVYLREPIRWNTLAGFACIALGAALIYGPLAKPASRDRPEALATEGGVRIP